MASGHILYFLGRIHFYIKYHVGFNVLLNYRNTMLLVCFFLRGHSIFYLFSDCVHQESFESVAVFIIYRLCFVHRLSNFHENLWVSFQYLEFTLLMIWSLGLRLTFTHHGDAGSCGILFSMTYSAVMTGSATLRYFKVFQSIVSYCHCTRIFQTFVVF